MTKLREITTNELYAFIQKGDSIQIIDVREDEEVACGMIEGARHIKQGEIPLHLNELDRNVEYYIICRSGVRSLNVCYYLLENDIPAINVAGGMNDWTGEVIL